MDNRYHLYYLILLFFWQLSTVNKTDPLHLTVNTYGNWKFLKLSAEGVDLIALYNTINWKDDEPIDIPQADSDLVIKLPLSD